MVDKLEHGKQFRPFHEDSPEGQILLAWWRQLQGYTGATLAQLEYQGLQPGMPGRRAELRRAGTAAEVAFCRAYQELRVDLPQDFRDEYRLPPVAQVLVWVKTPTSAGSLAAAMGQRKAEGEETPLVSELRFKRVLRIDDRQELAKLLIGLLPLVDRTANPLTLARDIWSWNEQTRKRWANDYYQALLG